MGETRTRGKYGVADTGEDGRGKELSKRGKEMRAIRWGDGEEKHN